jgi:hypothetical protein
MVATNKIYAPLYIFILIILAACGGGGGGTSYSCMGSGNSYLCAPIGSGGSSTPEPPATPFPVATSIASLVRNGVSASGLYSRPYTAPGTYTLNKTSSSASFNGINVTRLRTTTNWNGGYPTPYDMFFDPDNSLYGFEISGIYGLRISGSPNPQSVDAGINGILGNFNLYSDSNLTNRIGTATLRYAVARCCDLYDKIKGELFLTIRAIDLSGNLIGTLEQGFRITTSGAISFGSDKAFDGTNEREIYNVYF